MLESLRTRLTLWYVGILAVVLVAFSTGVYTLVERTLHAHQDGRLRSVLKVSTETLSKSGQSQSSVAERLQKLEFPNQVVVVFDSEGKVIAQKLSPPPINQNSDWMKIRAAPRSRFAPWQAYFAE